MTDAKASGWTSKRVAVVGGAVPAAIVASVLHASAMHEWDVGFALQAAVSGGLLGHLVWACLDVRHRITRTGAILVGLCLFAWAIFLLFGAPHQWPEPSQRSDGSFDLVHDAPIPVAGRAVGVFGSANAADRLLGLLAFPAIHFASLVVGLATRSISDPTLSGSYVVAGIASVLSCAWWLAVGNALSGFRRRRRERRVGVPATTT